MEKETQGVWVDIDAATDAKVKVARFGTTRYYQVYNQILQKIAPNPESLTKEQEDEAARKVLSESVAECILLDWRNFVTLDGTELPYSKEEALKLLSLDPFLDLILTFSQQVERYHKYALDAAVKN
ncbi:hypothetical protein [Snodgrassella sp. ESL0324]|uniref:hypothetical protein n=1 Tax=Snodgrassella sp. ESL0324 TaxID=2705033 RepID=UPI001581E803|nr:hypothetical protein [Snodgrassella sp. ESL0324]NUF08966.1 hypothetical protein [Snodgrassella sp. ESL0324]